MAHGAWQAKLEAYAEGTLKWPFTYWVESHTRRCPECRTELRAQLAFLRELDQVILSREEVVNTAYRTTQRQLNSHGVHGKQVRGFSMMVTGAAALLVVLAMIPAGINRSLTPGVTIVAASSWSEGVATSVPVDGNPGGTGIIITNPSGVGQGTGVAVPVPATMERGG